MASSRSVSFLSWIRAFHVYQWCWAAQNGETLQLVPEPDNPKDKNAVSVIKNYRVVGHVPLRVPNTKEGVGLLWHFLAKPRTSRIVKICGKAVNQGGGLGIEVPCQYIFTRPDRLLERLEKCLNLVRKEPSLTRGNTKVKAGKKRKTTAKSDKDHEPLSRKKYWSDWKPMMVNGIHWMDNEQSEFRLSFLIVNWLQ